MNRKRVLNANGKEMVRLQVKEEEEDIVNKMIIDRMTARVIASSYRKNIEKKILSNNALEGECWEWEYRGQGK